LNRFSNDSFNDRERAGMKPAVWGIQREKYDTLALKKQNGLSAV
jgi:hypothetical protein